MSSEEQEQWKARWLPKGLPETLLDEMIAEANAEYESELQYSPYNRYNSLGVIINDLDSTEDCFYLVTIQNGEEVFQGKAFLETQNLFAQIPTVEIVIDVFKLKYSTVLEIVAFGYSIFKHTKDESVTIDVNTVSPPPEPDLAICNGDFGAWVISIGGEFPAMPTFDSVAPYSGQYWLRQTFYLGFYRQFTAYHAVDNLDSNTVECLTAWFYRQYELTDVWFMKIHYSDGSSSERTVNAGAGWVDFSLNTLPNKIITGITIGTNYDDNYLAGFDDVYWEMP